MRQDLVSRIIEFKTNSLDAYVSKYFDEHLTEKKDFLKCFKKYETILKIDACVWALVFALDGQYFDELIIDEYSNYEIIKDLRFIAGSSALMAFVSEESIIEIGLCKEYKCIYAFDRDLIINAIVHANPENKEKIISVFSRVIETQKYVGSPIFRDINVSYLDKEMALLKSVFEIRDKLTLPPVLAYCAIHDAFLLKFNLEEFFGYDSLVIQCDIKTLFSDSKIKSQYVKIPNLLINAIGNFDPIMISGKFSFEEIMKSIKCCEYFECTTRELRSLILYVHEQYLNKFNEFEKVMLDYLKRDVFSIKYCTLLSLITLESALIKLKHQRIFKENILNLNIAYGLFEEFKQKRSSFKKGLKLVLRLYNVDLDYIVNLLSQIIDEEDEYELADFESFKNIFK